MQCVRLQDVSRQNWWQRKRHLLLKPAICTNQWVKTEDGDPQNDVTPWSAVVVRAPPSGPLTSLHPGDATRSRNQGTDALSFVLIFNIQTWGNSHFYSTILHNSSIPPVYNHKTMTLDFFFLNFTYKWKNRQVLQAVSLYSQHTSAVSNRFS